MATTNFYPKYDRKNTIISPFHFSQLERRKTGTLSNDLVVEDFTVLRFKPLFVRVKIELLQLFVTYMYP